MGVASDGPAARPNPFGGLRPPAAATPPSFAAVAPVAAAIGIFGIVYGSVAAPVLGAGLAVVSSVVVFSGAAQFAMVALLVAGADPFSVLWSVLLLGLRFLALGAVLRPRLGGLGRARRAGLAWFLIDETVGMALTARGNAASTLLKSGVWCHLAWIAGTSLGVAGAQLPGLEPLAGSVFPLLFIGLSALAVATRRDAVGAVAAALGVAATVVMFPGTSGVAPIVAAVMVSLLQGERR